MASKTKGLTGIILGATLPILGSCQMNEYGLGGLLLGGVGAHKGNPVAQVVGGQLAQYGAAQANASNTNVYVNGNAGFTPYPQSAPRAETFVCQKMVDLNGDGCIDVGTEAIGRGRSTFYTDETVVYAVSQEGHKGRELRLYLQNTPEEPLHLFLGYIIGQDNSTPYSEEIRLSKTEPGIYKSYWTLDGAVIGEHIVEIKKR